MPILPRNTLREVTSSRWLGLVAALGAPLSFNDLAVTPETPGSPIKVAATFANTSSEYQQSSSGKPTMQLLSEVSGPSSAKAAAKAALRPLERPRADLTKKIDRRCDQAEIIGSSRQTTNKTQRKNQESNRP